MWHKEGQFNVKNSWDNYDKPNSLNNLEKDIKKPLNLNDKPTQKESQKKHTDVLDILDNEIAKRILKDFKDEGGFQKKDNPVIQSKGHISAPKPNNDLLGSMAGRLAKLEATCNNQRQELKEKTLLIDRLQSELNTLKLDSGPEDILKLKTENEMMKRQINEMEKFLNDYGLKWAGLEAKNQKREDFNVDELNKDIEKGREIYKSKLPKEIDINVIERRIAELNIIIANEGESEIVKEKNGAHVFRKKESICIAFYRDGLIIKGYPFYKYSSREARQIIEDILDGYFPAVLKHKYPEGTLFKLITRIDEDFGSSIASNNNVNDLGSIEDRIFKPLSKEAFLNELPREVIKNGKIIPIRDAIAQKIGNPKQVGLQEMDQEGVIEISTPISEKERNGELTSEQIKKLITLKVRTESGKRTLIFKILSTNNIADVYKIIKRYSETKTFEIWGGYPPKAYINNEKLTLEDLDIYSDSAFNLRAL